MPRMVYAGAPCYLTPCARLGNRHSPKICRDGRCKGKIEGECPFFAMGGLLPKYEGLFAEIKGGLYNMEADA